MVDDFRIQFTSNMVHVLNAPSPAATASISIGRYIVQQAANHVTGLAQTRASVATTGAAC